MPAANRTVRVFISSTFRDMHAERDHLVTVVFPELRERVEQLGLEFFDVDLRWGVPETGVDGEKANSWEYCRRWIDRVEPFFVCMLGQRYGWVPKPHEIKDDDDRKLWAGRSVTDMEIRHAVLSQRVRRRSSFYLRETLVPEPPRTNPAIYSEFVDTDPISFRNLDQLKAEIRTCGRPVRPYACRWTGKSFEDLDAFGRLVLDDLWSGVLRDERYVSKEVWRQALGTDPDADPRYTDETQPVPPDLAARLVALAKPPAQDPLDAERAQMEAFAQTRLRWFQGRTYELQQLADFIASTDESASRLAVVAAVPGQGKSALIARLWQDLLPASNDGVPDSPSDTSAFRAPPSAFVIAHFVGATERSTTAHALVQRLLDELDRSGIEWPADEHKEGDEPKRDFNSLCERLRRRLGDYASDRRIVILLDALNQLTDGHDLVWLPHRLGASVRVVVSCVEGSSPGGPGSTPAGNLPGTDTDAIRLRQNATAGQAEGVRPEELVIHALTTRQPAPLRVPLAPLSEDDVRAIIVAHLEEYCKELDRKHVDAICRMEQAKIPLYLLVLLGELRALGGNDMQRIVGERIAALPHDFPDTVALFRWVLQRLEVFNEKAPDAVKWWCLYLAHGRVGMASQELADLLARKLGVDARTTALRIERGLRRYLQHRGPQLDFFHEQVRQAVGQHYLQAESDRIHVHKDIADYFEARWREPYTHAIAELPYHRTQVEDWNGLKRTLCNLRFIEAKCTAGMVYGLVRDYSAVLALPSVPKSFLEEATEYGRFTRSRAHLLATRPQLTIQEGFNFTTRGFVHESAEALHKTPEYGRRTWFRLLNRPHREHCILTFAGHDSGTSLLAVTPDGRRATSASHGEIKVWDMATGDCVWSLTTEGGYIDRLAAADAAVIFKSSDGHIEVRDLGSGALVGSFHSTDDPACTMTYVPTLSRLITGDKRGVVRFWDIGSGRMVLARDAHHGALVAMNASGHGNVLLTAGEDMTVAVWDAVSGGCLYTLTGHTDPPKWIQLTSDGSRALTASRNEVRFWDLRSAVCLASRENSQRTRDSRIPREIVVLALDGSAAVLGTQGGGDSFSIWDIAHDKEWNAWVDSLIPVQCAAITPNGALAVLGIGHIFEVWDVRSSQRIQLLDGYDGDVSAVVVTPDGKHAITGSRDREIRVWELEPTDAATVANLYSRLVHSVAISPDGRWAVNSISRSTSANVWCLDTGKIASMQLGVSSALSITPDSRWLLANDSRLQRICIWDITTAQCVRSLEGTASEHEKFAMSTDGRLVLGRSMDDEALKVWDFETGACVLNVALDLVGGGMHRRFGCIRDFVVTPNCHHLLIQTYDDQLYVWDLRRKTCLRHEYSACRALALVPGGDEAVFVSVCGGVAIGSFLKSSKRWRRLSEDGRAGEGHMVSVTPNADRAVVAVRACSDHLDTVNVYDLKTLRSLVRMEKTTAHVISPDGSLLVTTHSDSVMRFSNLRDGDTIAEVPKKRSAQLWVTPDGGYVVAVDDDCRFSVWEIASRREVAYFAGSGDLHVSAVSYSRRRAIASDTCGRVYLLAVEDLPLGPWIATAWRPSPTGAAIRLVSQVWKKNDTVAFQCPHCVGQPFREVSREEVGRVCCCPKCGTEVQLSPFTINADWRAIAKAWRGEPK